MSILDNMNIISVFFACLFIIPILAGIIRPLTSDRVNQSFASLFNNLILLISIILSIYLTRVILSGNENFILTNLYKIIPGLQNAVSNKEVWVSIIFMIILLLIIDGVLHLLVVPIYRYIVAPISNKIASAVSSMNEVARRIISGIWQLPKSICFVLVFSILLNFYTSFFNNSFITEYANESVPYQYIQENVLQPLLNNSVVKSIQVLFNDSFKKAKDEITDVTGKKQLIQYFNGVTLDEAIKSDAEIDAMAKKIVGSEANDKQKANLIYKWICKNIKYDYSKAEIIAKDPSEVSSGAIVAYDTKTGVCFDYSCLYVAMCRAVGIEVRFITGLGYTGTAWGDHAWNQVYYPKEDNWLNVDTTFGSSGINYFDRPNFDLDHTDGVVQGEW